MEKGTIKKIDELGRIVIPKDIRNNLKIKTGDILNINVDNDIIKLTKHSDPEKYKEVLKRLVYIFGDVFDVDIIITDRDKVIASNSNIFTGNIDINIVDKIINNEYYYSGSAIKYIIGDNSFYGYFYIEPIITSLSSVGSIILYSQKEMNEMYKNIIKFLSKYLENIFDISS